ncbi:hypothetical protein G6F56_014039 [Rhizopus delemar]|nr:hypothetical protein G6F56_014039 [Rhizopus delemar]
MDGNAQARAGLPDVCHRAVVAVGAGQAAWRGRHGAGAGWPAAARLRPVAVRAQPLDRLARGDAAGRAAGHRRTGACLGRDPAGSADACRTGGQRERGRVFAAAAGPPARRQPRGIRQHDRRLLRELQGQ